MAKRIKNSIRSKRSGLKLESLEQRQLLASIVAGEGTEVDTDITLANGNTYDQILLTGSTITIKADAGQVTRVDFLDTDGDIVRAEFAGSGELTISLDDFSGPEAPAEYATTTEYVMGTASFRITGSDETTNFSLHSLGTVNVHDGAANPIFDGGNKTGGDNWANVSRVVIESDGGVLGNAFGGIRAGNAVFAGEAGAVGIVAPEIQFQGPIIVGGIAATDDGQALLQIGQFSLNKIVTLAGTNLDPADTNAVDVENVSGLVMASGQSSMGVLVDTQAYDAAAFSFEAGEQAALEDEITYSSSALTVTLDENTTQDDLDDIADRYLNELVIEESFADSDDFGDVAAKMIGNVTIKGDLNFKLESTVLSIGNVTVEGSIVDEGEIVSAANVGNVTVVEDIDFSTDDYAAGAALIDAAGNVGNITFADVIIDDDAVGLVDAGGNIGNITGGKVSVLGAGLAVTAGGNVGNLEFTGALNVATTISADAIGNIAADDVTLAAVTAGTGKIGNISATDDLTLNGAVSAVKGIGAISAGGDAVLAAISVSGEGNIGAISADNLTIGAAITTANGSVGAISTAGDLAVNAAVSSNKAIGNISVTGEGNNLTFDADGSFLAGTTIGDVTVAEGAITSLNVTGAEFTADAIGNVTVTGADNTTVLLSDVVFRAVGADASIGNIVLDSTANAAGAIAASANAAATNSFDGTGFSSSGNIGNVTITTHEDGQLLVDTGDVLLVRAGNSNMGVDTADASEETVSIGNVSISTDLSAGLGSGAGTGLIIASGVDAIANGVFVSGDATAVTAAGKAADQSGSIGNLTINDFGGSGVEGFDSNTLAADTVFTGGSAILANSFGTISIEAGSSVNKEASGTARVGALDIDQDGEFTTDLDLFIVVL